MGNQADAGAGVRWLDADGARLHVRMAGQGPPLVLVHGWAMDHRVFLPQTAALAGHLKVVAYDRRGFGRSSGSPDLDRDVDDLDTIARALTDEPFHLLGLSQGGRIALRYAARRPERLRSLLLQGPAVDGEEPPGPDAQRIPLAEFAELARQGRLDELRRRWLEHPMMRVGRGHPEAQRLLRDMLADYTGADLLQQPGEAPQRGSEVLRAVAAAALPVLVLTGRRETRLRRRIARRLLETLPQAREVVLTHSGHLSNLTEPATYNDAVLAFCRDVDGRRRSAGSARGGGHGRPHD